MITSESYEHTSPADIERLIATGERLALLLRELCTSEQEIMRVLLAPVEAHFRTGEPMHPKMEARVEQTNFDRMFEMAEKHRDRLLDLADQIDRWTTEADQRVGEILSKALDEIDMLDDERLDEDDDDDESVAQPKEK